MKYCTYITMYSGELLPKWYIGSSTIEKIKKGYNGSVCSKRYKEIYDNEQINHKHLFKTRILNIHSSRPDAVVEELRLQKLHNVVKNKKYFNESFAQKNGCFARDKSGENNPMFGKGFKLIGSKNGRHSDNYDNSNVGKKISVSLKKTDKNKKENNPASKKYYIYDSIKNVYIDIKQGCLYDFCQENKLKYTTLYNTLSTHKPINKHIRWGIPSGIGLQLFEGTHV